MAEGIDLSFNHKYQNHGKLIALTGGRVVTMCDAENFREIIDNGTVLFRGDRIVTVGPADRVEIPVGAKRIASAAKRCCRA